MVVAEVGQAFGGCRHDGRALCIQVVTDDADAYSPEGCGERLRRGERLCKAGAHAIARIGTGHDGEQEGGIGDVMRQGADLVEGGCRCGEILKGALTPRDCPLFGRACTPARPVGPCMVSSEGTCAAYYRYQL